MSDNKTRPTRKSAAKFVQSVEHDRRREDAATLLALFNRVTGLPPVMWGDSLVGYGKYHYKYESGREGEFFRTGFSPRKQNMVVYIMPGFKGKKIASKLKKLGKHKTSSSCLYINKLADVDLAVLEDIVQEGLREMNERYPA